MCECFLRQKNRKNFIFVFFSHFFPKFLIAKHQLYEFFPMNRNFPVHFVDFYSFFMFFFGFFNLFCCVFFTFLNSFSFFSICFVFFVFFSFCFFFFCFFVTFILFSIFKTRLPNVNSLWLVVCRVRPRRLNTSCMF